MKTAFATAADGLRVHYATNDEWDSSLPPLVFVPGMLGIIDFYKRELIEFGPRQVVAFSHRGLGESQMPLRGRATFQSRCKDIGAVVSAIGSKEYFLCGFSRGVSFCVAHALEFPKEVKGLILIDCAAQYLKMTEAWLNHFRENRHPQFHLETIVRYCEDSENIDLTKSLERINCPTLILRGGLKGSLLDEETANNMHQSIKNSTVAVLPNTSHEISETDFKLYKDSVLAFVSEH